MELSPQVPAAAIDEERILRGDLVKPQESERDHPPGRRGPGAARHLADLAGPFRDLVAVDRRDVRVHAQAEQLAAHLAYVRSARHDFLADVASLREAQGKVWCDFQRERVFAHLHTESRRAYLD